MKRPLLLRFPRLASRLHPIELGQFPTPVLRATKLGAAIGLENLYIKRDDLSGAVYGGNKVRKLEFLLGEALRDDRREVLTFGFAGSNHALATAIYASAAGLRGISVLLPQPNAASVRRNLLMSHRVNAELHHYESRWSATLGTALQLLRHRIRRGAWPMRIPPGGSSPMGIMGIVNAVLELDEQVRAGDIPAPDCVYVAVGSMGTAVGLLIGFALTGMKCAVVPVRVIDARLANPGKFKRLYHDTVSFMRNVDPSIPVIETRPEWFALRDDYFGERYAQYSEPGIEAIRLLEEHEGIRIDGTYAGKALAALIGDAREGALSDKNILFWNTYNSRPFWETMPPIDYHHLPRTLHRYFEGPVQPLDR